MSSRKPSNSLSVSPSPSELSSVSSDSGPSSAPVPDVP